MSFLSKLFGSRRQVHKREIAPAPALSGAVREDFLPGSKKRFFEAFIAPILEQAKQGRTIVILGIVVICQALALWQLFPLKERIPYVAAWDENAGQFRETGQFKPLTPETVQQRIVDFQARNWVRWVLTIDSQTRGNLERASTWVRSSAVNELQAWIEKDHPGDRRVKDPDYTRTIEKKIVVTYGQGKTLFLHIELIERNKGIEIGRNRKLVQIDYDMVQSQQSGQVDDDDTKNPIDLAVIHFSIGDE
jgi:hypothetical protein